MAFFACCRELKNPFKHTNGLPNPNPQETWRKKFERKKKEEEESKRKEKEEKVK